MSEILRQWLGERLGVIVDYHLMSFEDIAQDGLLLAQLLHSYGIINTHNLSRVKKTYDISTAYSNLVYLRNWLNSIGVKMSESIMHGIANKQESVAIRLFYQLYVILNTKSKLSYLINKNINDSLKPGEVKKPLDKPYNACEVNELVISPYIEETRTVMKWHRDKYLQLLRRCDQVREEYVKRLEERFTEIERKKKEDQVPEPPDYNQTLAIATRIVKPKSYTLTKPDISIIIDNEGHCIEDKKKGKKFIHYLKDKHNKIADSKVIEENLHKLLLVELFDKMIEKENQEFKQLITSKILRQSHYEKQIAVKLIEVRHQKEVMLENLKNQNNLITKQREKDFVENLFQQKANLSIKEKRYYANKQRQLELHRRLYSIKCAKRYKEHYNICQDIMYDLTDLALKYSEYTNTYKLDVPKDIRREWGALFCKQQPIFDIIDDVTDILTEPDNFDEPLTMELYRQNGLDESDFYDYHNIYAVWNLEVTRDSSDVIIPIIESGLNILGFVVHRLLLLKYPTLERPGKPMLPDTEVRACVLGIENHEVLPVLQKALTRKEIIVLEMPTVIKYCLDAYAKENKTDEDIVLNAETAKGGETAKGKKKKEKPKAKPAKKGKSAKSTLAALPEKELVPKESQTPRLFPDEEIQLSDVAQLGQYAYETLNLGLQINENLITAMMLQYLKQLKHVKGFVLVNFPETLNEAYLLEEVLNGKEIPPQFLEPAPDEFIEFDFETRDEVFNSARDPYINIRKSKLLPNPKPPYIDEYYSFFTSFIDLKCQIDPDSFEDETVRSLLSFYKKLHINNSFPYTKFDTETIKELVKYILKDEAYANQIYEELMNTTESFISDKQKKKEEPVSVPKGKEKNKKPSKSDKKSSRKSSNKSIVKSHTTVVEPIITEPIPDPPKPGEENWEYVVLPITKDVNRLLSTTWQTIEDIYINNFKQLFFIKRVYQNQIIPYVHEIDTNMQNFIERPDRKQEYLHDFQKLFNEIAMDLREDDEFKAELHFRVSEFRDKLWGICDTRMKECEEERERIIMENWFTNHSVTFTNLYAKACQLELDRCVGSLQLLQDYYTSMAMKKPLETKLPKFELPKFDMSQLSDTQVKKHSNSNQFDKTPKIIAQMLIDVTVTTENSPFITFLNSLYQTAISHLEQWHTTSLLAFKPVHALFTLKPGKEIKAKKNKTVVTLTEQDIKISEKAEAMIKEWSTAIEGEINRTKYRLQLIREKSIGDINENLYFGEQLFHDIYNRIQDRYNEEVVSVDTICQIFARAIEACEPIQVQLIFDGAKFYIDHNKLFYPDAAFTYKNVEERVTNFEFTIAQLNMLSKIFLDLAPNGYMSPHNFMYLLEDMVSLNPEDCVKSPLPQNWHLMKPNDVARLVSDLYAPTDNIDWKDFIIWNLLLPYPTENELLDVRRQFRDMDPDRLEYVNEQQFSCVQFWFEEDFSDEQEILRMNLIKELLIKLFKIDEDKINYTALLFYFCKDIDSVRGVSKALELALGKLVCWDMAIGHKFICLLRKQKEIEEQRVKETMSIVNSVVGSIFRNTMTNVTPSISYESKDDKFSDKSMRIERDRDSCFCEDEEMGEEHEAFSDTMPELCYFLSFPVLLKVMTAAFPWYCTLPCIEGSSFRSQIENIYQSCKRDEFDQVFMHDFLNNEQFLDLISRNSKFVERIPPDIVRCYVEVCTCANKREKTYL